MTKLDPCENDTILYTIGTSGTWTHGKLLLHDPSLSEIKSQLSSRSYEYRSTAVIKRGFYMGSRSDVTPLLGDYRFINIGRKKFIQMDGILVHNTNPFDFSIRQACMSIFIMKIRLVFPKKGH